ncbi:MAG: serine/threonine-protein kinase, partial [Gemmatimonadota bacterium]
MSDDRALERLTAALSDRYADLEEIGRGGMATVYRARDVKHDRVVAIKVLDPEFGVTLGADRFLREISIEARLQHPNILALFDSGQAGEFLYFVTPFAAGGSLRDRLARERQLPIDEALRITRQIGDALSHAHAEGIVHRDVKPANILFNAGHAMLADFGIARAASNIDRERLTKSGVSVGTPAYMSPEQAAGAATLDARSDLYSLGCVLFEMLAGEPPFTGHNLQVVLARQISERPPSVEVARPGVPPPVAAALTQALAKTPADRQATVTAFIEALESERGATPASPPSRWSASRIAAGVLAVAVALGGAWWLSRPEPPVLSPDKVAVFPLATRGVGAESALDGTGVAYLIEAALEHADPLRMIDVATRLTERELVDPSLITAHSAREISRGLGAGFYLDGVVQGHRDSTTVILRLHDVAGDSVVEQRSVTGEIGVPIHHLGIDALRALLPSLIDPSVVVDLAPLRERKASAVALWLQAERAYRGASFRPALDLYERALADDSALAIAAVKGSQAADWLHENARGRALVDLALSREALLPHRYAI